MMLTLLADCGTERIKIIVVCWGDLRVLSWQLIESNFNDTLHTHLLLGSRTRLITARTMRAE